MKVEWIYEGASSTLCALSGIMPVASVVRTRSGAYKWRLVAVKDWHAGRVSGQVSTEAYAMKAAERAWTRWCVAAGLRNV